MLSKRIEEAKKEIMDAIIEQSIEEITPQVEATINGAFIVIERICKSMSDGQIERLINEAIKETKEEWGRKHNG
jgi:hypothetical protein